MNEQLPLTSKNMKIEIVPIDIKRVSINEIDKLQEIARLTFSETFSSDNTASDMKKYLDTEFSIEKLKAEVTDKNSEYYFAVFDNEVIGYLKVNFGQSQTEIKDENVLEIQRIYVLNKFHGKKVGQQLYDKAMEIARQQRTDFVWLGVWKKNPRAIRFYEKNGFKAFDQHSFKLGDDEQTDIMMKRRVEKTTRYD